MHAFIVAGVIDGAFNGAIKGALVGGAIGAIYCVFRPARKCPECGERFSKFAKAKVGPNGGSVCGNCGAEVDRAGKKM